MKTDFMTVRYYFEYLPDSFSYLLQLNFACLFFRFKDCGCCLFIVVLFQHWNVHILRVIIENAALSELWVTKFFTHIIELKVINDSAKTRLYFNISGA